MHGVICRIYSVVVTYALYHLSGSTFSLTEFVLLYRYPLVAFVCIGSYRMNSVFLLVFVVLSAALAIDIHQLSSEVISLRASKDPVPLLNLHGGWKFDVNFDVRLVC
jgi:hypothetical protein